jgi:hypothetical protein
MGRGYQGYLVGNCHARIGVEEPVQISPVDLVDHPKLLRPIAAERFDALRILVVAL